LNPDYLDTHAAMSLFIPEPASDAVDAGFEACNDALLHPTGSKKSAGLKGLAVNRF
jgi:hypothetical protein